MRCRTALLVGLLLAAPRPAASGNEIRDPLVPPAALYEAQSLPPLALTLLAADARGRRVAMLRLGGAAPERRLVRAGERVGPYRVIAVEETRVVLSLATLGAPLRLALAVGDTAVLLP